MASNNLKGSSDKSQIIRFIGLLSKSLFLIFTITSMCVFFPNTTVSSTELFYQDSRNITGKTIESNIDNSGVIFDDSVDFSNTRFKGTVNFRDAVFLEEVDFSGAVFEGLVDFSGAVFHKEANFNSANYMDRCHYTSTIFKSDASFNSSQFNNYAHFGHAVFKEEAVFTGASFFDTADFYETIFENEARFDYMFFYDAATFAKSVINKAVFWKAVFTSEADFRESTFIGFAVFHKVDFEGDVYFWHSSFLDEVSFYSTNFNKEAHFASCNFNKEAFYLWVKFDGAVNFHESIFKGRLFIRNTVFLQGVSFKKDWFESQKDMFILPQAEQEASRIQKQAFEKEGNRIVADLMYIREMRALREDKIVTYEYNGDSVVIVKKPLIKNLNQYLLYLIELFLIDISSEYGTNWIRMIAFAFILITLFAVLCLLAPILSKKIPCSGGIYSKQNGNKPVRNINELLWFSSWTFFSISREDDLYPKGWVMKSLTLAHSIIGVVYVALIIVIIVRTWVR